ASTATSRNCLGSQVREPGEPNGCGLATFSSWTSDGIFRSEARSQRNAPRTIEMTHSPDSYSSPLAERYASRAMLELWSPRHRYGLWRRLWLALAESQRELGIDIPADAIAQMRAHVDDIDFDAVAAYERRFRHDVMAHVHAYGDVAPAARPFIHLGATSAFVTDNADLILMRRGMELLHGKVVSSLRAMAEFARK